MWLYAVTEMVGGQPNINNLPLTGYALSAGPFGAGNWSLYLFSGTLAQLTAIGSLANVLPLAGMTDNGIIKWPELNNTITTAIRNKWNTWLTARGKPTIPAGWTYKQILIKAVEYIKRLDDDWSLDGCWVKD